jgi:hypothetical protein
VSKKEGETEARVTAVEVLEELTQDEEKERHRLELRVQRAFYEAGSSLRSLRDKKLYRSTHKTFQEYCGDRFGYNRSRSYQLIDAAGVVENLQECPQFVDKLPSSESLCRPLTKLTPTEQQLVWGALLAETCGSIPTGSQVKGIVERIKEKPLVQAQDFCEEGDIFLLKGLVEEERKYNGCWAIASDTSGINVGVDVHDGTIQVKPENLKPIDASDARRQLPLILKRIRRLRDCGMLDRCAYTVLESLGRQTYLTDVEQKLLSLLEQHYGITE